jgi:hypothetical protein
MKRMLIVMMLALATAGCGVGELGAAAAAGGASKAEEVKRMKEQEALVRERLDAAAADAAKQREAIEAATQ